MRFDENTLKCVRVPSRHVHGGPGCQICGQYVGHSNQAWAYQELKDGIFGHVWICLPCYADYWGLAELKQQQLFPQIAKDM